MFKHDYVFWQINQQLEVDYNSWVNECPCWQQALRRTEVNFTQAVTELMSIGLHIIKRITEEHNMFYILCREQKKSSNVKNKIET